MKAEIEVLHPGLFSSIQDMGRFGFQKFGVPQSGVMDRYAMRFCNLLLGNKENDAVLEITFLGPKLKFSGATTICLTGGDLMPLVNGERVGLYEVIQINPGDRLEFGKRKNGFRSYLGIKGGFNSEEIMNSRSWYEGLTSNFNLNKGDKIAYFSSEHVALGSNSSLKYDTSYLFDSAIEAFEGPEFKNLSEKLQNELFEKEFAVAQESNRMAVQFQEAFKNDLVAITTGPVVPGTVQLTPGGNLIVLMKDCQTSGGYPRILQLSEKGQQILSQKMPGEKIRFRKKDYFK